MINKDNRIVPIVKTDFLSLIGTTLALIGTSYAVIESADVKGTFQVTGTGAAGNKHSGLYEYRQIEADNSAGHGKSHSYRRFYGEHECSACGAERSACGLPACGVRASHA